MGCVSSKIMTKSASFREEFNRSMRLRRTNSTAEEIIITKNSSDQFVALLCAANAVAQKLKDGSPVREPRGSKEHPLAVDDVETINTWELLAGLEEGNDRTETIISSNASIGPSRSFRTVEDFDAMVAANQASECSESTIKKDEDIEQEQCKEATFDKGSKRKAMAKELTVLEVPAGFEFARTGSLKEWLMQGGQVFSPGSYVTPKFGNFVSPGANNGDATIVFDPDLIEQFEQAMDQMTKEEENILKEIVEGLDNEECVLRIETREKSEGRLGSAEVTS